MNEHWATQLSDGLHWMQLTLHEAQRAKLLNYLSLLQKWNKIYNLTAVRNPQEMVSRQLLDSLSILPLLRGRNIIDVGTGPGLPGIPLAIASPDISFTLLDSNGKKCRFVEQAIIETGLPNVLVVRGRVEEFRPATRFDMVLCRAFASLPKILDLTSHLFGKGGCLLAMKGALHKEEITAAEARCKSVKIFPLKLAGTVGQRHAVVCRLDSSTEHVI